MENSYIKLENSVRHHQIYSEIISKIRFVEFLQIEIHKCCSNINVYFSNIIEMFSEYINLNIVSPQLLSSFVQSELAHINFLNSIGNNLYNEIENEIKKKASTNENIHIMSNEVLMDSFKKIGRDTNKKIENNFLKQNYLKALESKDHKRNFQVYYIFKNKIKRMYRVDCMTRKINVNFYHYLRDNSHILNINEENMNAVKENIRSTSKEKFQAMYKKFPRFSEIFNEYLHSFSFKKLVDMIKARYDTVYQKLFFRHSINFLNYYLKERDPILNKNLEKKSLGKRRCKLSSSLM